MNRGAPVAACANAVRAALAADDDAVPREMVQAVGGADRTAAERAARGLKKIAERRPETLYGLRRQLFRAALQAADVRVRWNLTIVLGLLPLEGRDREAAVDLMFERLRDPSGLNRTFALQALWNFSAKDVEMRRRAEVVAREFLENGTAAMRARAKRLIGGSDT